MAVKSVIFEQIKSREEFPLIVGVFNICFKLSEIQRVFNFESLASPTRKIPAFGSLQRTKSALLYAVAGRIAVFVQHFDLENNRSSKTQ